MAERQKNGTGSFRKRNRGGKEFVEYRVSIGIGMDGNAVRKSFYGSTERDCLKQYKAWMKDGQNIPIEKVKTVGEWADKWLELYKKGKVAYGTYRNYKLYVDKHIKPRLGKLKFTQVRPAHIEAFLQAESELSESARHHILIALNGMFETAIENHYCSENPVKMPKSKPLEQTIKVQVFSKEEINAILRSELPAAVYPQILMLTGMRRGELLALTWSDIDFDNDVITVSKAVARSEEGGYEIKTTKSGKTRYIGMGTQLKTILQGLPRLGIYVLSTQKGERLSPNQFDKLYKRFFTESNLEFLSPHKCRHTYATYLQKGGADLRAIQELLGHSKVTVTEIYTHVDAEDLKKNVSKLAY